MAGYRGRSKEGREHCGRKGGKVDGVAESRRSAEIFDAASKTLLRIELLPLSIGMSMSMSMASTGNVSLRTPPR